MSDAKASQNKKVKAECLDTERKYFEDLGIIVRSYKKPLTQQSLLTSDQLDAIFLNVEEIFQTHDKIVKELNQQADFCATIQKYCKELGKHYASYCERNDDGVALWQKLVAADKNLKTFEDSLKEQDGPCKGLFLKDFLIKPVQRICKYPLLFRELAGSCQPEEADKIQAASDEIGVVLKDINVWKDASVNFQALTALTTRIVDYEGTLVKAERKLLREAKAGMMVGKPKDTHLWKADSVDQVVLIILNDIILICKQRKGDKLKLLIQSPLHSAQLTDAPADHPHTDISFFLEFECDKEAGENRMIFCQKSSEKGVIYKLLKNTIRDTKALRYKKADAQVGETDYPAAAKKLFDAVSAKDVATVKRLCGDPNIAHFVNLHVEQTHITSLYLACKLNVFPCVVELLNVPAIDVNLKSTAPHKSSPLHTASFGGCHIVVAMLLARGADSSQQNSSGLTARQEAKGEAFEVYDIFEKGGTSALVAKYPILVNCVSNESDLLGSQDLARKDESPKASSRHSSSRGLSRKTSGKSGSLIKIQSTAGALTNQLTSGELTPTLKRANTLKPIIESAHKNACSKCDKKLVQDLKLDFCYHCGNPLGDKLPVGTDLEALKLEYQAKYEAKYRAKYQEKYKAIIKIDANKPEAAPNSN